MITYKKLDQIQKSWGLDITCEFTDTETKQKYVKTFCFTNQKMLDLEFTARMIKAVSNLENSITENLIQNDFTREEIEEILKVKGYLTEEQKLEDLTDKEVKKVKEI